MDLRSVITKVYTIQPFFVQCTNLYYKKTLLDSPVAHFYSFTAGHSNSQIMAVPDGCIDILFSCDPRRPEAAVCGTVTENTRVAIEPDVTYFGVRFHPGVLSLRFGIKDADLVNNRLLLSNLPGGRQLVEQIVGTDAFTRRIDLFADHFLNGVGDWTDSPSGRLLSVLLGLILSRSGDIQVRELEEETGYSARYIDKVFHSHMGVSPKAYCKFIRFQTFLHRMNTQGGQTLVNFAVDAGYYDHSHMLRDFKAFTSLSPQQYKQTINLPVYSRKIIDLARVNITSPPD
ncbi:MAG: helix-turn-helix domain-containing protein [Oscillospiraceae bacterium]|jgi:AraC-like DNA-binding protein|nr:helix-turn-helix domain-containing protein [Oscillospiraceae bacterium]